jgi:hypothetical protein
MENTMYQQTKHIFEGRPAQVVKRLSDNAFIPFALDNTDYQAYLAWLAEGHEPLPPDDQTGQNTPIQE